MICHDRFTHALEGVKSHTKTSENPTGGLVKTTLEVLEVREWGILCSSYVLLPGAAVYLDCAAAV